VDPRAGLDDVEDSYSDPSDDQPVAIPTELSLANLKKAKWRYYHTGSVLMPVAPEIVLLKQNKNKMLYKCAINLITDY
jgi:hypothetical protein